MKKILLVGLSLFLLNRCITETRDYQINNGCIMVVVGKNINYDNITASYKVNVLEINHGKYSDWYESACTISLKDSACKFLMYDTLKISK